MSYLEVLQRRSRGRPDSIKRRFPRTRIFFPVPRASRPVRCPRSEREATLPITDGFSFALPVTAAAAVAATTRDPLKPPTTAYKSPAPPHPSPSLARGWVRVYGVCRSPVRSADHAPSPPPAAGKINARDGCRDETKNVQNYATVVGRK